MGGRNQVLSVTFPDHIDIIAARGNDLLNRSQILTRIQMNAKADEFVLEVLLLFFLG